MQPSQKRWSQGVRVGGEHDALKQTAQPNLSGRSLRKIGGGIDEAAAIVMMRREQGSVRSTVNVASTHKRSSLKRTHIQGSHQVFNTYHMPHAEHIPNNKDPIF